MSLRRRRTTNGSRAPADPLDEFRRGDYRAAEAIILECRRRQLAELNASEPEELAAAARAEAGPTLHAVEATRAEIRSRRASLEEQA